MGYGKIISLNDAGENQQSGGGGHTQAALAASRYGLVAKVSQDGPISFTRGVRSAAAGELACSKPVSRPSG